ncbi:MAG: NADH:flavin oxidoreductase/NADH oxidase family protein [Polyangiales bacterium]
MTRLQDSLRLACGVTIKNRFLKSAMTEGLADERDRPTPAHTTLYERWAHGGLGISLTGNVMVDHRYLERPGNVVVEDESAIEQLSRWAEAGTRDDTALVMQISHPGRQCTRMVTGQPVAPSAVQLQLGGMFGRPRALTEDEIVDIIARYARTASIAQRAGFTGVQVHGAHGYLCSQFLSPRVNQRTDQWGGSLENRARFLREVVRAVRKQVGPAYPVLVKLNSSDFQKGAFTLEEACQVAAWLVEDGIDLLEISGGTYERMRLLGLGDDQPTPQEAASTQRREAYFLDYAAAIRAAARVPLAVTGGFRSPDAMQTALAQELIDVVGLARPLCVDPEYAQRVLEGAAGQAHSAERELSLGPGFFGPTSASDTLRGLNAQALTAWYYAQILQLAAAKEPLLDLSARSALWAHYRREYGKARARKAARRSANAS